MQDEKENPNAGEVGDVNGAENKNEVIHETPSDKKVVIETESNTNAGSGKNPELPNPGPVAEGSDELAKAKPEPEPGVDTILGAEKALNGVAVEKTKEQYLNSKGLFETDIQAMAAVVHDIIRNVLGRFENFALAGDFRIVHLNESKVFLEYVTGAINVTDGNAEEFYAGLCDCYHNNGYQMNSEYNPVNKKTIWGKPFTDLSVHQKIAFHCIYAFLVEYITVRQLQFDNK
jgi:hypothetical protein